MPIPLEKLKEAQKPLADRVYAFLQKNAGQAFDIFEIVTAVEGYDKTSETAVLLGLMMQVESERTKVLRPYWEALTELVASKKVEAAQYKSREYYAATQAQP